METTKAITDSKNFFNDIDRHFELLETNKDFRDATHVFEKGKKLWLEVEVDDPEMSAWLYKWLYSKNDDGTIRTPFGCELQSIHFAAPATPEIKQKLQDLLNSL